ncbi:putative transcription initiation factor TFIID subunit 13 [Cladophialophora carrionii]|uniref:Transcription initiation factor TFIID subunit 13 n=1 Tax=Cladophialophora carrionii TaxID=86049 RepID=A0A1C1CQ63_9EURO|nr:putative transcription initiation factor TFIID subunit 13 [Cladophialophora carrionii]
MEPRARAGRHKNNLNFGPELSSLLYAYGAPTHPDIVHPLGSSSRQYLSGPNTPNTTHPPTPFTHPFPETLRVLDEMLTDFIIETCHDAVSVATYSGRAKLKLSDFEFVLRRDSIKLGRVQEMFKKKRDIDNKKKLFDTNEGREGTKLAVGDLVNLGEVVGEEGTGKGKGRGRGRRKKRDREEADGPSTLNEAGKEKTPGARSEDDGEERASKRARSDVG